MQSNAEVWERLFSTKSWGKYPNEDLIRMVSRVPKPRGAVLEIGCGTGANLPMLLTEGFSTVFAFDISPTAVSIAQERAPEARVFTHDATMGFPSVQPQVICDVGHLYHQPDAMAERIVREAYDLLPAGGYFFATELGKAGTFGLTGEYNGTAGTPVDDRGFVNFRTLETVEALFSPFEHVEIEMTSRTYEQQSKFYMRWNVFAQKRPSGR